MVRPQKLLAESITLSRKLFRTQLAPLTVLFALSCLLTITAEDIIFSLGPIVTGSRIALEVAAGIWDMIEGLFLLLILSWAIPTIRPTTAAGTLKEPFNTPYLESFFAEYLRTIAQVLLYTLLLIIPGFVRYARLIFVPFVVLFSQKYRDGDEDALETSVELTNQCIWYIAALLIASVAFEVLFKFTPNVFPGFYNYPVRVLFSFLSYLISVWSYAFLFLLFENAMENR